MPKNLGSITDVKDLSTKEYVDGKVVQTITDGATTTAPSQNAVFDALLLKSNLASPTFTGTPAAPTAAPDTNTVQLATTAFVVAQAGSSSPVMDGVVTIGTSKRYSRQDHVHPTDTSRAPTTAVTTSANGLMIAADKTKLNGIATSANNYVHPNHSGDVTSVADGTTTITNDAVINAKLANMVVNTIKGRATASTGDPEDLTATQVRTILNIPTGFSAGAGTNAVIEGDGGRASGFSAHAEGRSTTARGNFSHTEGFGNYTASGLLRNITSYSGSVITLDNVANLSVGALLDLYTNENLLFLDIEIVGINGSNIDLGSAYVDETFIYAFSVSNADKFAAHAEGNGVLALGTASHAEGSGTIASGGNAHAEGSGTIASGYASHASGLHNTAKYAQLAIGQYATISSASDTTYSATNELFIIGNGTGTGTRGNAFKVLGNGSTYADGAYASTGADYAEYFEWEDGNPSSEDRVGYFVTLEGDKIRKAVSIDDYILGIVSATPSVVGDNYEAWQGKYVTDEWGRVQYHDVFIPTTYNTLHHEAVYEDEVLVEEAYDEQVVEVLEHIEHQPIYNPEWDPTQEYIPREKRKEWSPVGIIGKLLVRDDGSCVVNSYCKPNDDGIATASTTGYKVIKRVSANIIQVFLG